MKIPTTDMLVPAEIQIGVVGLGLMGSSIVVALLKSGHPVIGISPLPGELARSPGSIRQQLEHCDEAGLLEQPIENYIQQLTISGDYNALASCQLVLECVTEKPEIKREVYGKISAVVSSRTLISSNTSAIPISLLQTFVPGPERFLGIHWAEPAYMTRFLEITCGDQTDQACAQWAYEIAHKWGKEPTLLKKDIRGFITNRLMYAVYREGLALAANGNATLDDMDKAFRYDAGSWMTMMGIFRRLDYTGLGDLQTILTNIVPELDNSKEVPAVMQEMVARQARGTKTGDGFYTYEGAEGQAWEDAFAAFNKDIDQLAAGYPSTSTRVK